MKNYVKRLEHIRSVVDAYLTVNEEILREYEENGENEIAEMKKDLLYLDRIIQKAKQNAIQKLMRKFK